MPTLRGRVGLHMSEKQGVIYILWPRESNVHCHPRGEPKLHTLNNTNVWRGETTGYTCCGVLVHVGNTAFQKFIHRLGIGRLNLLPALQKQLHVLG